MRIRWWKPRWVVVLVPPVVAMAVGLVEVEARGMGLLLGEQRRQRLGLTQRRNLMHPSQLGWLRKQRQSLTQSLLSERSRRPSRRPEVV